MDSQGQNNINSIDGDLNGDGKPEDITVSFTGVDSDFGAIVGAVLSIV